jgi:hypothetical protein
VRDFLLPKGKGIQKLLGIGAGTLAGDLSRLVLEWQLENPEWQERELEDSLRAWMVTLEGDTSIS